MASRELTHRSGALDRATGLERAVRRTVEREGAWAIALDRRTRRRVGRRLRRDCGVSAAEARGITLRYRAGGVVAGWGTLTVAVVAEARGGGSITSGATVMTSERIDALTWLLEDEPDPPTPRQPSRRLVHYVIRRSSPRQSRSRAGPRGNQRARRSATRARPRAEGSDPEPPPPLASRQLATRPPTSDPGVLATRVGSHGRRS
jgi:hypothetical protein